MNNLMKLCNWYEKLDENNLEDIEDLYHKECFFKDPFNEMIGTQKIKKIFKHMFANLDDPHFRFIDIISEKDCSFLTWDFIFIVKGKEFKIHGSTHLKWSEGRVVYHRDYWDVGEELLLKIPILKTLYKYFMNKFSVGVR